MRENAALNLEEGNYRYQVRELTWGKTGTSKFKPVDVLLGADIVYHETIALPLLKTAYKLCDENTKFYLAWEMHDVDAAQLFWKRVGDYFMVEQIDVHQLDDYYRSSEINVLCLTKILRVEVPVTDQPTDTIQQPHQ
eukprot:TRINITY_DN1671_c0_g1_i4.p1 TRINITY_DN1671_c0_g1~~TRINITY_DN1671_c0_g1_i4.p1  ORF type:complete len:137 (-),score=24.46 TRINITY_DN1671_c0_g1_i4:24-434(-)